jgi:hypothetical protein
MLTMAVVIPMTVLLLQRISTRTSSFWLDYSPLAPCCRNLAGVLMLLPARVVQTRRGDDRTLMTTVLACPAERRGVVMGQPECDLGRWLVARRVGWRFLS